LAAWLRPDPLWELTPLPRPCSWISGGCLAAGEGRRREDREEKEMGRRKK